MLEAEVQSSASTDGPKFLNLD